MAPIQDYKDWIYLYLLILLAILGAFCFGMWIVS